MPSHAALTYRSAADHTPERTQGYTHLHVHTLINMHSLTYTRACLSRPFCLAGERAVRGTHSHAGGESERTRGRPQAAAETQRGPGG